MSTPAALLVLAAISVLFFLMARTLIREIRTGVPHLFFSPHPAYRNRPVDRRSTFLWFSVVFRIFGTAVLAFMVVVAVAFLLESLGVIYN
jgi:hypothetical protein